MLLLNFELKPEEFIQRVKTFSPKPGAYVIADGKRIKILEAKNNQGKIDLITVQLEGKKVMSYRDFCLGNKKGLI